MDDDLMSLRSSVSSSSDDDDLLGSFGSPSDAGDATDTGDSSDLDFGSLDEQPEWLRDLGPQPEETAHVEIAPKEEKKKKKKPARRSQKSGGNFMGLTPQQRMILVLFLFLEVSVISILVLIVTGAIKIPIP